jgi:phosphoglycerate-specific signal transduction histidine kinase
MANIKQEDFDTAAAADYHRGIMQDLEAMSPGQLIVARRAISDFENKQAANSTDRKIAKMTDRQLQEYVRDLDDERRRINPNRVLV